MPGFAGVLDDRTVADIANYVRVGFGGRYAPNVTPSMVADLRAVAEVGAGGTHAARAFDCPAIGAAQGPKALATPADVMALASGGEVDMANKVGALIDDIRKHQPGISDAALTDVMMASFCPVVANNRALDNSQRRARLLHFSMTLEDQFVARALPAGSRVLTTVPLAPGVMQQITRAAAEQHQTPAQWMADSLAQDIGGSVKN